MQTTAIKLRLIMDGMSKKEQAMVEIANITENQGTVLSSGLTREEINEFMSAMNREKQLHIQTVLQCDKLFESILKEIGPILDANPDLFKPQIQELQTQIRRVMDLDVKIRVCEDQNNAILQPPPPAASSLLNTAPAIPSPEGKSASAVASPAGKPAPSLSDPIKKAAPKMRSPKEPMTAPPKQAPLIKNENRIIKAYESNSRNYKG